MAGIVLAVEWETEARLIEGIIAAGHNVLDRVAGAAGVIDAIERCRPDVIVMSASPDTLTRESLGACERGGCRPVGVVAHGLDAQNARSLGLLETVPNSATWSDVDAALRGERLQAGPVPPAGDAHTRGAPNPNAHWRAHEPHAHSGAGPEVSSRRAAQAADAGRGRTQQGQGQTDFIPVDYPEEPGRRKRFGRGKNKPEPASGATAADIAWGHTNLPKGRVVAVWGPHGSPGASTVAISIAACAAARGERALLIDADTYGGAVAGLLGISEDAPGFAAACRLAGAEALTDAELDRVAAHADSGGHELRVLTGIPNPARWPELSRERVTSVLRMVRDRFDIVVVDVGFNIERDDEIASDPFSPRRNAAALATLEIADQVVTVSGAEAVSLQRFLRARLEMSELTSALAVHTVVNRVRAGAVGFGAVDQVRSVLSRFAGIDDAILLPNDARAADRAILAAAPIPVVSGRSQLARGLATLTDRVLALVPQRALPRPPAPVPGPMPHSGAMPPPSPFVPGQQPGPFH